jgi:hypothetical protein
VAANIGTTTLMGNAVVHFPETKSLGRAGGNSNFANPPLLSTNSLPT